MIVIAEYESNLICALQQEAGFYRLAHTFIFLICNWPVQSQIAGWGGEQEIPSVIGAQLVSAGKLQSDCLRAGAGAYQKVEFQILLRAVESKIDAWINVAVVHTRIAGDGRPPFFGIVAD